MKIREGPDEGLFLFQWILGCAILNCPRIDQETVIPGYLFEKSGFGATDEDKQDRVSSTESKMGRLEF